MGKHPAPFDMANIPLVTGFWTSQTVIARFLPSTPTLQSRPSSTSGNTSGCTENHLLLQEMVNPQGFLDLLVRCLEKVPKIFPNGGEK